MILRARVALCRNKVCTVLLIELAMTKQMAEVKPNLWYKRCLHSACLEYTLLAHKSNNVLCSMDHTMPLRMCEWQCEFTVGKCEWQCECAKNLPNWYGNVRMTMRIYRSRILNRVPLHTISITKYNLT